MLTSRPLFPRYLFVWIEEQWKSLLGTFGVTEIILVGDRPASVADNIIEGLKAREVEGHIVLPGSSSSPKFKPGQKVRIQSGIFAGQSGVYDGMATSDRERVLLDYLGRRTPVLIAEDHLEPE